MITGSSTTGGSHPAHHPQVHAATHPHAHPVARRRTLRAVHVVLGVLTLAAMAVLLYYGHQYEQGWDRRTDLTVCRLAKQC